MSHQPFEDWLLDDAPRSTDMERLLEQHLVSCARCRALVDAWAEVEPKLRQAQAFTPRPGFRARWWARYWAEQVRRSHRQPWTVLAGLCASGLPLAAVLIVRGLTLLRSPAYLALTWMEGLAALVARLYWLMNVLGVIRDAIQGANPAVVGVGLAAALTLGGALWVASVYRYAVQGVRR